MVKPFLLFPYLPRGYLEQISLITEIQRSTLSTWKKHLLKNNAYLPSFVFQKTKLDESLESEIYGILQGYINNGIGATYKTLELIALKMASQKGIINF